MQNQPKIFLDMDGVLADFFTPFANFLGGNGWDDIKHLDRESHEKVVDQIAKDPAKTETFFANLNMLPGGKKIIQFLRDNHLTFTILSAPLSARGVPSTASIRGKKHWMKKHGLGDISAIFTSDKYQYATAPSGIPNILIDDFKKNIIPWRDAGGIAIHHKDETADKTIHELQILLNSQNNQAS